MRAIVPSYGHYVAYAHPPGRVRRAVPPNKNFKEEMAITTFGLFLLTARTPRCSGHRHRFVRFSVILQEPSDGQEHKQDSEDDPNINAHQSSPAAGSYPLMHRGQKKAPGKPGLSRRLSMIRKSRDQGALDAPILSQGINQARRGSRPGDSIHRNATPRV